MSARNYNSLTALLLYLLVAGCSSDLANKPTGRYPDQSSPQLRATVFAPGLISTDSSRERDICFSSDFSELYFTRDARIMTMHRNDTGWTTPEPAAFGSEFREYEARLSPDDQRLYFISRRPADGGDDPADHQLWMVSRTESGWGAPELCTDQGDYYPSFTSSGVMYFTDKNSDIYRTPLVDGRMSAREKLSEAVNTDGADYNAFVAPDESFLLFSSDGWGDGFGGFDMYISFRTEDGRWTQARNMGLAINTSAGEYCPALSPDGEYLFFARRDGGDEDIYWIDAAIIDTLRKNDMDVSLDLYHAFVADSMDAMKGRYIRVREDYASYRDFDGDLLIGLADRLLAGGRPEEATEVLRYSFELYPDSRTDLQRLKLAALERNDEAFGRVADEIGQNTGAGTERMINLLGYQLVECGKIDEAIKVFRLNTGIFPQSSNVYDSYAEALAISGDTATAIENYRISLALDPENYNAVKMLRELSGE
jgi:tetratricopeptide (TPR) repeat protein